MSETTGQTTEQTTEQTTKHRMSGSTIVWAITVLVVAGLAFVYFATDPQDITPTVVLTYAILAGAALVAIGILGAIVRLVVSKRAHPPIG